MTTMYPTLNWRDFALKGARYIEEGDQDGWEDWAKDARLFEGVPCPSVTVGGPNAGTWPPSLEAGKLPTQGVGGGPGMEDIEPEDGP